MAKTYSLVPSGSNQYFLLMVSSPSLAFISQQDLAGSSGIDPKAAVMERKQRNKQCIDSFETF